MNAEPGPYNGDFTEISGKRCPNSGCVGSLTSISVLFSSSGLLNRVVSCGIVRRHFPRMAVNPYSNGESHSGEMAQSRIHGKTRSLPYRSRNTTRGHLLTRISEYCVRRPGMGIERGHPTDHQEWQSSASSSLTVCR